MWEAETRDRRVAFAAGILAALLAGGAVAGPATAQEASVTWAIQPETSVAWWQIDPHYAHLWATTCPRDPSWQAGEGRDPEAPMSEVGRRDVTPHAKPEDPDRIPLYPRQEVRAVCRRAVSGTVTVRDTAAWSGVTATVEVLADSLYTGLGIRDTYARRKVLETHDYPTITFRVDSIADVRRGDTLRARAIGSLTLHGVTRPMEADLTSWIEGGSARRVRAQFQFPARELTDVYEMSRWALGLGVVLGRWEAAHAGVDLILREEGTGGSGGR